jgi:hypothetical protein
MLQDLNIIDGLALTKLQVSDNNALVIKTEP